MDKLDKNSVPYRDGGYEELFEAEAVAQLTGLTVEQALELRCRAPRDY